MHKMIDAYTAVTHWLLQEADAELRSVRGRLGIGGREGRTERRKRDWKGRAFSL